MIERTDNNRPKNRKEKNAILTDILCDIDTGYHWCCGTSKEGDLNKYGVGVAAYFKFVKYLAVFFSIFVGLTIPILVITFKSNFSIFSCFFYFEFLDFFLIDPTKPFKVILFQMI